MYRRLMMAMLVALLIPTWAFAQDDPVETPAASEHVVVTCDEIQVLEPIAFGTGTDGVAAESLPLLTEIAEALNGATWIHQVQVEGHTDATGSSAYNQRISHERAKAVAEHLTMLGVAPARVTFIGYGETRPIASNDTAEGRAMNRRISFTIVERDACPGDGETTVE